MECYSGNWSGVFIPAGGVGQGNANIGVQLYRRIVFTEAIPDLQKNKIVMVFSEMDKRLVDGADEHLSVLDLVLRIAGILRG